MCTNTHTHVHMHTHAHKEHEDMQIHIIIMDLSHYVIIIINGKMSTLNTLNVFREELFNYFVVTCQSDDLFVYALVVCVILE